MNPELIAHLLELRKRLIYLLVGFVLTFVVLFPLANHLYAWLSLPLAKFLPASTQLIATDITSPFFVPVKMAVVVAVFLSLPNSLYQLWQFIAPGLYQRERKLLLGVMLGSLILFVLGMLFCYFLVLPAIFHFINNFKAPQITMLTDIDKYLSFVLSLFLIFGLAFEMPVLVFLLIRFGILKLEQARKIRKYVFVGCFILAAIVTPPDILSQTMLAIPLYLLYELGILIAHLQHT